MHTGAEVRALDLSRPMDEPLQARLNRAFVDHSVLVFRDQHLTPHQLLAAVGLFGDVFPQHNPRFALSECPLVHYISNQDSYPDGRRYIPGEGFHTDHSNALRPPKATVLHAVSLPDRGGDTQYVNMHVAYDDLPEDTKRASRRTAGDPCLSEPPQHAKIDGIEPRRPRARPDMAYHPIVRTHPESGRKAIYLNPIRNEGIVGMPEAEALRLLADLLEHATQPKYQYRHQWQPGDLVMWDNRSLLHKANGDYDMKQLRYLYRVMLQGDVPV